jgi:molecular chaperone GrpE (heat shock protein)
MSNNQNIQQTEKKFNETYDKVSAQTQDELARVKAELAEFKRKSQPKVQEAENYLTSPSAIGFYQG